MPLPPRVGAARAVASIALTLVVALLPTAAPAQARFRFADTATILPKTVTPTSVTLQLDVDPAAATFGGDVKIVVQVHRAMPSIVLHAAQLEAQSLVLDEGGPARTLQLTADRSAGTWRLQPEDGRPIAAGRHVLRLRYRGTVQPTAEGLYAVDYSAQGQPQRMLATQLEAISARSVVPSFDEPVFRTRWRLTVRAPAGYEVVSNTPRLSIERSGDATLHHFAPTPPMQSYLLSLAVGRFDAVEGKADDIPLRVLSAPGKGEQGRAALAAAGQFLPYYRRYFGQRYALPKLDLLAVPGLRTGAMEDWGLIGFAENRLLFEPGRSDPGLWVRNYGLIAHEVSHQWFGNLVSPATWSEMWLNESFATWMQRKIVDELHPEWQGPLRTRLDLESTMNRDATAGSRPIRGAAVTEERVNDVFDEITYDKGGAVLAMLEQWIGPRDFRRGLQAYMAERAFKPATAGDLWHHMQRVTGLPVARVAGQWTDQQGLPLVDVDAACRAGATEITLRQSRFAALDPLPAARWSIPVRLVRGSAQRTVLLEGEQARLLWPGCDEQPLLANAGAQGYFRIRYAALLQQRLLDRYTTLAPADRLALLADSHALAIAGLRPLAEYLTLLQRLPHVHDASRDTLFALASSQLQGLDLAFDGLPVQPALHAAGVAFLAPEFERLGWQPAAGESAEAGQLRAQLVSRLARFGYAPVLAGARDRLPAALANDTTQVAPALRGPVMFAAALEGTPADFDTLLDALRRATSTQERWLLLGGLRAVPGPDQTRRLLDEALSGRLPANVSAAIPSYVAGIPANSEKAYMHVLEHWDAYAKLAGTNTFSGRQWLLPRTASGSTDAGFGQRLLADQKRLLGDEGTTNAASEAAAIVSRSRLREREGGRLEPALHAWVANP